ncbi:Beta-galactosidase [subsurface metagenome]
MFPVLALILFMSSHAFAERTVIDLAEKDWGVYRDLDAEWVGDNLHLPPVDISRLPVNPPSCGWDGLDDRIEKTVRIPATIEEHFWGDNGNSEGVGGDYRGVSWWVTTVWIDPDLYGKRFYLDFDSVHLRAEVFVNRELVGYDIIGHTPFSVDAAHALLPGKENEIAVRITDPLGNFNWNDRQVLKWGKNDIPACHGFGGITGGVSIRAVDDVAVEDIYVKNKPSIKNVDLIITAVNRSEKQIAGNLDVKVYKWDEPEDVLWKKRFKRSVESGANEWTVTVKSSRAEIWSLDNPNLYNVDVTFVSADETISDTKTQRFGFRWFDIGEKKGDQRLYLNGKRIVLLGGMSWGFWPVNGVFPTREMAERDVLVAKEMGLNYVNFHRAIGQPVQMDVSDERGFLTYEESGGYSCEGADTNQTIWRDWRREKLFRMVKRDRSRPSMIIYNLQNRTPNPLSDDDLENMKAVHAMDPTRILTFISGFWQRNIEKEHPTRLFFKPNDDTEYYTGWFDLHNHSGVRSYSDRFYNSPVDFLRYTDFTDEVIFWGEDGNLFSPPRLQLIKEYHDVSGAPYGWQGRRHIEWYNAYDNFLDRSGFRQWFPDVDAFTVSMGNTTMYYHGRIIENCRAGNVSDAYTINGWAAPRLANQSEVVDLYRNPDGNPELVSRYCRPLYVAVKLRDKVAEAGETVAADIYLVNETGLKGTHDCTVIAHHESGRKTFEETYRVNVDGGEEYGQLSCFQGHRPRADSVFCSGDCR